VRPFQRALTRAVGCVLGAGDQAAVNGRRVLIAVVDDDASVRRALGRVLGVEGLANRGFASAEELLSSPDLGTFTCLVLDIHLGGMSGLDLLEQLKREGHIIPVVLITAHDDEPTRERACSLGASAYLRKPVETVPFLEAVHEALEPHHVNGIQPAVP
jgi:FixJ family two-component response regulator